jgi:hypothetical protein
MDIVLIILGVLGMGAIVIAAYVFTVAARNYVSNDINAPYPAPVTSSADSYVMREPKDRRRGLPARFPLSLNDAIITHDRRRRERRAVT